MTGEYIMDITQERYSLLRLWLESFKVVNRCTGKLAWVIIISILLFILVTAVLVLAVGTSGALAMLQMKNASQLMGAGAILAYFLVNLGTSIYGVIFFTVCCRLMANQALNNQQSLADIFSSSVLPALCQIAAGFLIAIPFVFAGIVSAILARISPLLSIVILLALFVWVGVRLCYSFISMAVANKGPIEGLTHSWKMTAGKNYLDTLLMCVLLAASALLMYAFFAAIGYGFFVMIPLHFAESFNLAHPSFIWILVACVLGILAIFGYFVLMAFPVLVFLNRNAVLFDARNMIKDTTFVPLPALELPDIHPNPEHMQKTESTVHSTPVLTEADLQNAAQTAQPATPPTPAPQPAAAQTPKNKPEIEGLEVSKSSINTSEEETNNLSEHLDQVYKPKPEDIVQYVDEDRMPTILFDDEMAKQLQANQAQFAPKNKEDAQDKKDNGPETIKMSKF